MKFSDSIQKLLPFSYLFLVIMGVLKESVFYYQVGINILHYSTITDILISPIADLAYHPVVLVSTIIVITFSYVFPSFLSKKRHKNWVKAISGLKSDEMNEDEIETHYTNLSIKFLAIGLLAFFVGIGLGGGFVLSKKIKNNKLEYASKLNYSNGESEQIYLIGSNSLYYFYLVKEDKNIRIAPIGAIKNIELTNDKTLK